MEERLLSEVIAIGKGVVDDGSRDEGTVDVVASLVERDLPVLKT